MFRFASPGMLKRELRAAGLSNVHEDSIAVPRIWTGSPEELPAYLQEVSTLCHLLFGGIPQPCAPKSTQRHPLGSPGSDVGMCYECLPGWSSL